MQENRVSLIRCPDMLNGATIKVQSDWGTIHLDMSLREVQELSAALSKYLADVSNKLIDDFNNTSPSDIEFEEDVSGPVVYAQRK